MNRFSGKRVLIIGAARQGLALSHFLVGQGAHVTLNDRLSADQLQAGIDQLAGTGVEWVLGDHPLGLLDNCDLVCVSGGVPLSLPIITEAVDRGIPLSNDSQIFMEMVKAPVVGITGSAGKTTTTSLFGRMAQAEIKLPRQTWVGGNIGNPLIEFTSEINHNDLVIQELSSFQLELMTSSPQVAAVLNITPNHLDRHAGMADYIRAKSRILAFQGQGDTAVLNRDDVESWNLRSMLRGSLVSFGREKAAMTEPQVYLQDGAVWTERDGNAIKLIDTSRVSLRGAHNMMNVLAACALSVALNFSPDSMAAGVDGFNGVKHRLQLVRVVNDVSWFNDSIATAPERTLAALNTFDEPIVLLLGGRDKNLPWEPLAKAIHERVDHVVIFGEAGEKIAAAVGTPDASDRLQSVVRKETMIEALEATAGIVSHGDVVLLSPGCTSYDAFKDFEERGETFIDWVNGL